MIVYEPAGTPQSLISSIKTKYEHEEDFQSDYVDIKDREYVFSCIDYRGVRAVFRYVFSDTPSYFYWNGKDGYFVDGSNIVVMNSNFDILDWDYVTYYSSSSSIVPTNLMFNNLTPLRNSKLIIHSGTYSCGNVSYYSDSDMPFKVWASYESLYNYIHGSQNAYLSSKVEEAGEDIKMSINDMNDNIGSKIDDLIDSINNKKEGMSADELQKAIDNALDSLSKKVDDIGDNTAETNNKLDSLLSLMSEQNNILLQILGVTEYIAYNTTKEDGSDYTTDDLKNTFNTMYDGVRNAILYGTNTVSDSGSTVSVAAYSSEDLAMQDINNLDVHNGLFGKFPFSIPYQLYEWLQVLEAEPAAPTFNYNYGFMIFKKDDPDCNLTIDLSVYEPWANQAKSFERLFFTLLMAVFIYKKFILRG